MMTNENLIKQIELLRNMMISTGMSKGFTSSETITISEKLDNLINIHMGSN